MKSSARLLAAAMLLATCAALAQADTGIAAEAEIGRYLYPPDKLMRFQSEIGISEQQRAEIKAEIHRAQVRFLDLQWQQQAELEKLEKLLAGPRIDEAQAIAQAQRLMQAEAEIKKVHLAMLIRVKNLLTPEQQAKIDEIRGLLGKEQAK